MNKDDILKEFDTQAEAKRKGLSTSNCVWVLLCWWLYWFWHGG